MTTVYVITVGSGDSYRIERVYLDRDQAYRFAQDYNGKAPVEPVQVDEWQDGAPPSVYDGPYWRAEWWAHVPVATRRGALRHTDEGERFDDFAIRQEWPVEEEGGGTVLGHHHPGQGRPGRSPQEVTSATVCVGWKEMGMATRLCRPDAP
jgi:hypothetical protein